MRRADKVAEERDLTPIPPSSRTYLNTSLANSHHALET